MSKGHQVTFLHHAHAADLMHDQRIGFHATGRDTVRSSVTQSSGSGSPGVWQLIRDMAATTEALCRELPGAIERLGVDVLLCDQMEAAGGLVGAALNTPYVSVACALPVNREPHMPLPVMPFLWGASDRDLLRNLRSTQIHDWLMRPHMRAVAASAASLGLDTRRTLDDCLSPLLQISQTTEAFDFPRFHAPSCFHHVGPMRSPDEDERLPGLHISTDAPFVFASLGTTQGHRFKLFLRIADACRQLGAQSLLAHCGGLTAEQERALMRQGATWVTDFAPQHAAVRRADVVICHAGLNTVLDAMAMGKPALVLPVSYDQPGVGARVHRSGMGLRASPAFTSSRTMTRMLQSLLVDPLYRERAQALARAAAAAGGVRRAAELIERAVVRPAAFTVAPAAEYAA